MPTLTEGSEIKLMGIELDRNVYVYISIEVIELEIEIKIARDREWKRGKEVWGGEFYM